MDTVVLAMAHTLYGVSIAAVRELARSKFLIIEDFLGGGGFGGFVRGVDYDLAFFAHADAFGADAGDVFEGEMDDAAFAGGHGIEAERLARSLKMVQIVGRGDGRVNDSIPIPPKRLRHLMVFNRFEMVSGRMSIPLQNLLKNLSASEDVSPVFSELDGA